jgi:hypothetical protein
VGIASDQGGTVTASEPRCGVLVSGAAPGDERDEPKYHRLIIATTVPPNETLRLRSCVTRLWPPSPCSLKNGAPISALWASDLNLRLERS